MPPVKRSPRHRRRKFSSLAVSVATLLAVVYGTCGLPISAGTARRSSERFPCENCPCGCSDAATCWRQCCCMSNQQKLAWARKNGVAPPAFVLAASDRERLDHDVAESCCATHDHGALPPCCRAKAKPLPPCCLAKASRASAPRTKLVLLISAMKCKGLSLSPAHLPPALPPHMVRHSPWPNPTCGRIAERAALYASPWDEVATPPPDAAVA